MAGDEQFKYTLQGKIRGNVTDSIEDFVVPEVIVEQMCVRVRVTAWTQ